MSPDPKHRLAAILFADIVGYTAMMQSDEAAGIARASRLRSVVENLLPQHGGQLVEMRGDGAFCLFESSTEAVRCAIRIQQAVRAEVPLRIGLHLGDITERDGHIFGDAVNIASRVESMGVPGAVLLSRTIRQQIKNKPEFELQSMGHFAFKNVAEPMEVFAVANAGLVVPKSEEMQGKGKQLAKEKQPAARNWIRMASLGFVAMAVGAALFWALGSGNPESSQLLDKDIREAKVAVAVFENRTGDENLDALGYLGSEWISAGLQELEVRTVSSEMVRKNQEGIGILPTNSRNKPSFAEITGAEYVITGSYFLKEDSILLNMRLSSAITGEEITHFTGLTRHIDQKEELVGSARRYLMGYWAAKQDGQAAKIQPPAYEVYQVYLQCLLTQVNCFEKVLELDSTFLAARIGLMSASAFVGDDDAFYKHQRIAEQHLDKATPYEKLWFKVYTFVFEGKWDAAYEILEELYRLDPKDPLFIHQTALAALVGLNQSHQAIERFEEIFDHLPLYQDDIVPWSYYHYIDALNRTGQYEKASDFYLDLPESIKVTLWGRSARYAMFALIYQGRIEDVINLLEKRGSKQEEYLQAAFMYRYVFPKKESPFKAPLAEKRDQFEDRLLLDWEGIRLFDWKTKASVYYVLEEWEKAEEVLLRMQKPKAFTRVQPYPSFPENAYWEQMWYTSMLGCIYARLGETTKAKNQITELQRLGQLYPEIIALFHRGTSPYLIARIYAELGEKDLAVQYLQESAKQGRPFGYMSFTADMFLVNLKGYEPFEELIRPKG